MKTSSAKAKGRRCSSNAREAILRHYPEIDPNDIVVTSSGDTGVDLKLGSTAIKQLPLAIECKNVEALNIWGAFKQAESNKSEQLPYPVVIYTRNRSEMMITLKLEDFLTLTRKQNA